MSATLIGFIALLFFFGGLEDLARGHRWNALTWSLVGAWISVYAFAAAPGP